MSAKLIAVLVTLIAITSIGIQSNAQGNKETARPYTVSVEVKRSEKKGVYDCSAVIKDAKTGEKLFDDHFDAKIDDQTKVSTIKPGWLILTVTVVIDKEGKRATYKFSAERDDKVIQEDEGQIAIK